MVNEENTANDSSFFYDFMNYSKEYYILNESEIGKITATKIESLYHLPRNFTGVVNIIPDDVGRQAIPIVFLNGKYYYSNPELIKSDNFIFLKKEKVIGDIYKVSYLLPDGIVEDLIFK